MKPDELHGASKAAETEAEWSDVSPDLYSMKLNERLDFDLGAIVRVPGGWVYITYSSSGPDGYDVCSVFVPFHNEFQPKPPSDLAF